MKLEVNGMSRWTKWMGLLLLALLTPSCLAVGNLHDWANETAPRSEVIGVIDGGGNVGALIVRVHGEDGYADGLYEAPIEHQRDPKRDLDELALKRLGEADVAVLESMPEDERRTACLEDSDPYSSSNRLPIAGFERVEGTLRRIDVSRNLYYVSVCGQAQFAEGKSFTKVAVHRGHAANGDLERQGAAYVPPARSEAWRVAVGVVAMPIALALDVVTSPLQTVVLIVFLASFDPKFLEGSEWSFSPPLQLLSDGGVIETTWFLMSCVPMLVDPAVGGMLLQWPKVPRPLKI